MSIRGGVTLFNSSFIGSSAATAQSWVGGRTAAVVDGGVFGANSLTLQHQGGLGNWINIASTFLSTQLYVFDAPPGMYRVVSNASSAIGVRVDLASVPYF